MPFAFACLALSMLLVGGNIAIGKLILAEVPVYLFAALRFLIASLVLLPGMFLRDARRGLDRRACGGLFLQAFFGCFLFSLCMLHGVLLTSATSAGIITSATPSVIALLAWLWLRERISAPQLLAIVLAVSGIAALNLLEHPETGSGSVAGNLLVLGAVLAEALFAVFSRRLSLSVRPWAMAFGVNLAGLLLFLPLAAPQALAFDWSLPGAATWSWLLLYALSASVLSFLLWYRGIAQVPANVAGLFTAGQLRAGRGVAAGRAFQRRPRAGHAAGVGGAGAGHASRRIAACRRRRGRRREVAATRWRRRYAGKVAFEVRHVIVPFSGFGGLGFLLGDVD